MELSLADAARMLALPEHTLYWWARRGEAPAYLVGDRYRFNEVELLEWAARRSLPARPAAGPRDPDAVQLKPALERGGIHRAVPGGDRAAVLRAVVDRLPLPDDSQRPLLLELLLSREDLGATAIGGGIALPHPRQPVLLGRGEPRAALALLERQVDFGAPDGEPVRALLVLICASVRAHLALLRSAARAFSDAPLRSLVLASAGDEELLQRLAQVESADGAPPVPEAAP
ncbi:MAG: PTS sugar transporter subunit IIA [Candidatus Eisenbacteria bacterium]|nr:PTS sugar transporter subunit IIA [Candidatus Eisenbacteria bacterium]